MIFMKFVFRVAFLWGRGRLYKLFIGNNAEKEQQRDNGNKRDTFSVIFEKKFYFPSQAFRMFHEFLECSINFQNVPQKYELNSCAHSIQSHRMPPSERIYYYYTVYVKIT